MSAMETEPTETLSNGDSTSAVAPSSPSSRHRPEADHDNEEENDQTAAVKSTEDEDNDADDLDENEEALFNTIEDDEAKKEETADHSQGAAPKLLQQYEGNDEVKDKAAEKEKAKKEKEEQTDAARQKQLEFLLNKASEYSNFIARDLQELQAEGEAEARKMAAKAEKALKKRKKALEGAKKNVSKKAKLNIDNVKTGTDKPIFVQPPNLAAGCHLKDYQLEGVRWLSTLFENGVSGILADEMGLGKTIQCVGLIAHLLTKDVTGPFIVVAPLATLPNWVREFEKWLPTHKVVRYHGPDRDQLLKGPLHPRLKKNKDFPFIVTSYETAIRDQAKLEKLCDYTYMIVDEG